MAEIKIKPCQKCGGNGRLVSRAEDNGYVAALVRCENCGHTAGAFMDSDCYFVQHAIEKWNEESDGAGLRNNHKDKQRSANGTEGD